MTVAAAQEGLRILRRIDCSFSTGPNRGGSGFVWETPDTVITCAHVVQDAAGVLTKLTVDGHGARVRKVLPKYDIAILAVEDADTCQVGQSTSLVPGDELVFAGFPSGVRAASVFAGIVSAIGKGLVDFPTCETVQISGMINLGNSGGPVLSLNGQVVAVVTAKNVPLLREIDSLREIMRSIPQFPSDVGIGKIDFSAFVNLMTRALLSISSSLRLVQVGVGYAVPVHVFAAEV